MRTLFAAAMLACIAALAGCTAKLDHTKEFTVPPFGETHWILDAQSKPQKIKIEVQSDQDLDVFVLSPDMADKFQDLKPGEAEKAAIAHKKGVKAETVTADIPAKTAYSVLVGNPKKTATGKVHITNQ